MGERLQDKVAIVTGAGTGIGKAIAVAFAREGAHVVGAARRVEKLQETRKEIDSLGQQFLVVRCDITKKEDCDNVVRETIKKFGRVDILVNNAAYFVTKRFLEITPEEWDAVLATNLRGCVQMCQAVLPQMIKQKKGKILMVNSDQVRVPGYSMNHYAASKGGLLSLTRSLASEFGRMGINVNGFCCGYTPETEQAKRFLEPAISPEKKELSIALTPLGRLGRPEDYQGIAVFLACDESDFITGQNISVDGGRSMP